MLLLLIRHAHAGERDPDRWPDDRDRPLTDKGRKIQRKMSRALGKLDLVPTMVLASPWARAAETAATPNAKPTRNSTSGAWCCFEVPGMTRLQVLAPAARRGPSRSAGRCGCVGYRARAATARPSIG